MTEDSLKKQILEEVHASKIPEEVKIDTSQFTPLTIKELSEILGITIKRDEDNKVVTFLGMLSAYTEESQFNISFNAPSSTGKSFIPVEISAVFPDVDVLALAYTSPTSFFHSTGVFDKERGVMIVDLSRKIIIFQDQPHNQLLERLRPLLSHDKKVLRVQITDKNQKYGTKTKQIEIIGYPAVIFCSAGLRIDEQESTRFILLSPEMNQEKIREAINSKIERESNPEKYKAIIDSNETRELLKLRIQAIKAEKVKSIKLDPYKQLIKELYLSKRKVLKPRHQRDIGKIISLIKSLALLNLWFRDRDGDAITVSQEDIINAFEIWDRLSESQEYNLPPYIFNFYWDVIVPCFTEKRDSGSVEKGVRKQELMQKHKQVYGTYIEDWKLRQELLPMLETSGLISTDVNEKDKRVTLIIPQVFKRGTESSESSGGEIDNSELVEKLFNE